MLNRTGERDAAPLQLAHRLRHNEGGIDIGSMDKSGDQRVFHLIILKQIHGLWHQASFDGTPAYVKSLPEP